MNRYDRYCRRAEVPLMGLALLFLLVISLPVIRSDLPSGVDRTLGAANVLIWLAFAADYVTRLALVDRRWHFIRTHPVELAAVALPALRPLRLLRLFSIGSMLAARSRRNIAAQAGRLVLAAAVLLIFVAAVAVLDAERGQEGANISDFNDALWWSATTITTVGYGDQFPVTGQGRAVAVTLMVLGIALIGVITASIATWFVQAVGEQEEAVLEPLEDRVARLEAKIDLLLERENA